MALVKIWLGALAAIIVFLCLQSILQQDSDRIELAPVAQRT
ncbi:hypothetical protein [Burkholderia anthina]|nr:hypothetical protein [Burkholderia anthina]